MVLEVLTRRGAAVRVDRDLSFDRAAVDEARERLEEALARLSQITLAQYRDEAPPRAAVTRRRCSSCSTRRESRGGAARGAAAPDATGYRRGHVRLRRMQR